MLFGESKRYYIERRIADRMAATGTRNFNAYFAHVDSNRGEVEHLINIFTVNETYFYREEHQLRCLSRSLLPEIVQSRKPGDLVRIWSVPCSTGEEPYSIAIWLLENWPLVDAYHIEIVGSDIDTQVLLEAQAGNYGERALSRLPPDVVERYFDPGQDGQRRLIQDLRESVKFTSANLVDSCIRCGAGTVRRHLLPQRPHLFRRFLASPGREQSLRLPAPGRLHLSRPYRVHDPDLEAVRPSPLRGRDRLSTAGEEPRWMIFSSISSSRRTN